MDLLQLLILLTITGICGAVAVFIWGFSPRGIIPLLFAVISGVIGAALGGYVKSVLNIPDFLFPTLQIGTTRIHIVMAFLGSLVVVGLLRMLLRELDRRATPRPAES